MTVGISPGTASTTSWPAASRSPISPPRRAEFPAQSARCRRPLADDPIRPSPASGSRRPRTAVALGRRLPVCRPRRSRTPRAVRLDSEGPPDPDGRRVAAAVERPGRVRVDGRRRRSPADDDRNQNMPGSPRLMADPAGSARHHADPSGRTGPARFPPSHKEFLGGDAWLSVGRDGTAPRADVGAHRSG